ncbi:MAG: hypothetical protein HY392_01465 [Candidatus Diapherotrites archaeon]|nr:hypothetical protein [Candidatus Diapherotrites archaeon]
MDKMLFVLLVGLALVSGCAETKTINEGPLAPPEDFLGDENQSQDANYLDPEQALSALEACKAKLSVEERDICIQELALQTKDTGICSELEKFSPDFCIKEIGIAIMDYEACGLISQAFLKDDCYNTVAVDTNSSYVCEKILSNTELRIQCKKTILVGSAGFSCDKHPTKAERNECFTDQAKNQSNPLICELVSGDLIKGAYIRDECLSATISAYDNPDACGLFLEQELKDNCFLETAKKSLDGELCKSISPIEMVDECLDFVARENGNHLLCYLLSLENGQKECINYVAESNPVPELCDLATSYASKDKCNHALGVDSNSSVFCEKISGGELKDDCFYTTATANNDAGLCRKIGLAEHELKNSCFATVALGLLDETICENIPSEEDYVACFASIAAKTNEITICDNMQKVDLQNYDYAPRYACYKEYAIGTKQPLVCDLIEPPAPRQECIDGTSG